VVGFLCRYCGYDSTEVINFRDRVYREVGKREGWPESPCKRKSSIAWSRHARSYQEREFRSCRRQSILHRSQLLTRNTGATALTYTEI